MRPDLGPVDPVDNPPTVSVTDPAEGATVSGQTVLLAATASDDVGVTPVEFFVDGIPIGFGTSMTWDSTTVGDGAHVVTADSAGRQSPTRRSVDRWNPPDRPTGP